MSAAFDIEFAVVEARVRKRRNRSRGNSLGSRLGLFQGLFGSRGSVYESSNRARVSGTKPSFLTGFQVNQPARKAPDKREVGSSNLPRPTW